MAFWTEHPKWVQNPKFTASPLLSFGSPPPPPRDRITLDRKEFLHMVLFSSSKCNVSRLRKTSVYDRKKLASIKIVHKGVKSEFLKKHYFLCQRSSLTFAGRLSTAEKGTTSVRIFKVHSFHFSRWRTKKTEMQLGPLCSLYWSW